MDRNKDTNTKKNINKNSYNINKSIQCVNNRRNTDGSIKGLGIDVRYKSAIEFFLSTRRLPPEYPKAALGPSPPLSTSPLQKQLDTFRSYFLPEPFPFTHLLSLNLIQIFV